MTKDVKRAPRLYGYRTPRNANINKQQNLYGHQKKQLTKGKKCALHDQLGNTNRSNIIMQ